MLLVAVVSAANSGRPGNAVRPNQKDVEGRAAADSDLQGFRVYVINMDSQKTRMQGFRNAVGRHQPWMLGVLQRLTGIDGRRLLVNQTAREELLRQKTILPSFLESAEEHFDGASRWSDLSPGAVGLYLSHAAAWQDIVDRGLRYGMIFEDDLRFFSPHFEPTVRALLRGQLQADFAYLQHCEDSSAWPLGAEKPEGSLSEPPLPRKVVSDELIPGTSSYVVSQQGARRMLREMFPITMQMDRALSNATMWTGLRRIIFEPALAQVGAESYSSTVQTNSFCVEWGWKTVRVLGMWSRHLFAPFCAI